MKQWWNENWPPVIMIGTLAVGMIIIGFVNGWSG